MSLDDDRLAKASRGPRRRQGLRQIDLAVPGRSRDFSRQLEAGRAGSLRLDDIRGHFAQLGATVRVSAWWNGAALDRTLDDRHARVVDGTVSRLIPFDWLVETEFTFSEWGERGSIDVFAAQPTRRAVFVGEAKSAWGSIEETLRVLNVKSRLAPVLAERHFGFQPTSIATVLIFPEDRTARRIAQRFAATLETTFPARNREVKAWRRQPAGSLRGLWFLTDVDPDRPPRDRDRRRR